MIKKVSSNDKLNLKEGLSPESIAKVNEILNEYGYDSDSIMDTALTLLDSHLNSDEKYSCIDYAYNNAGSRGYNEVKSYIQDTIVTEIRDKLLDNKFLLDTQELYDLVDEELNDINSEFNTNLDVFSGYQSNVDRDQYEYNHPLDQRDFY